MNYADNSQFNDEIDSRYGEEIIIAGFSASASRILYEMDREAYVEAYNQYLSEQRENFPQVIYDSFPAPIAFYFEQSMHGYDNSTHRLQLLRSTWESLIYTIYALILGEVVYREINLSSIRIFENQKIKCNKNGIFSDRLGYELELIEKILKHDQDTLGSQLIASEIIPITAIDRLRELNSDRNSFSHSLALTETQAENKYQELSPKVFELLFELQSLQNISLIQFEKTKSSYQDVVFLKFDGHSLKKKNHSKNLSETFIRNNLPLLSQYTIFCEMSSRDDIICLSPFAHSIQDDNGYSRISFFK